MRLDEDDDGARDATAPIDALESYFEARGWQAERLGEDEIVTTVQGSWTQYELRGVWRPDDGVLQFLALPDIRVPADKRAALYEAIGLINEQLWLGHFEMYPDSGQIIYRHGLLLRGAIGATPEQCEALVQAALEACDRYFSAFQFVIWAGKSAAEAAATVVYECQGSA